MPRRWKRRKGRRGGLRSDGADAIRSFMFGSGRSVAKRRVYLKGNVVVSFCLINPLERDCVGLLDVYGQHGARLLRTSSCELTTDVVDA